MACCPFPIILTVEATLESNIAQWNLAFGEYTKFTSKTPQEALEHKVNALGIALWKGFSGHQFGGKPRDRTVGEKELAARTANHRGTRIRATLMAEYEKARDGLRRKAKALKQSLRGFGGTLDQWSGITSAIADNQEARISAWQSVIGREVHSRQSGIGQLGAAFLWYRRRGKGENRRLVENRRGKTMGSVEVGEGVALIAGNVDGLNTVDARYGVVAQAIADETNDTLSYIKRRQEEAALKLTRSLIS